MASHKTAYGQCETFFVDSDDSSLFAQRAEARDKARASNRLRQRELAEQLSLQTAYDYQDDILDHMEHMESDTMPDVNSIDIQTEIQWFMRPYLLDFLVEAHAAFQLLPETLYLAVNILDRYCSKRVVYKRHYQLVGCAALLIAAKYGDRKDRVPLIKELKSMCCSLYDDEMFTQMEWHVLVTLNWIIGHPTVDSFLQIALSDSPYDRQVEHMTWYICEMALYHKEFVSTLPSVLARSALALARCILSRSVPDQSDWAGRYDSATVVALSHRLHDISVVLKKKYQATSLSCSSTTVANFLQRQAQMAAMTSEPPTPTTDGTNERDQPMADISAVPVTPQKGSHQPMVAYGYATPPITPDTDYQYATSAYGKGLGAPHPQQYMALPTPPGAGTHLSPQHSFESFNRTQQVSHQYYNPS